MGEDTVETVTGEVFDQTTTTGGALEVISRAEIDTQISTAHRFPRSVAVFKRRATEMATLDEETAQSCIYRRPVGKDRGQVVFAEGKSIRMAEIVGAAYGNLRVGAILIEQTPRYVKARGMAHDLESNFAATSEVVEATVDRNGNPYSERMRVVAAKAALSKARRDATFMVVPGAMCKSIEQAARDVAFGNAKTLQERRAVVMDWLNKIGVDPPRAFAALGIVNIEELGVDQLTTLQGLRTAIKDGDTSIAEAFPPLNEKDESEGTKALKDKVAKADKPKEYDLTKLSPEVMAVINAYAEREKCDPNVAVQAIIEAAAKPLVGCDDLRKATADHVKKLREMIGRGDL